MILRRNLREKISSLIFMKLYSFAEFVSECHRVEKLLGVKENRVRFKQKRELPIVDRSLPLTDIKRREKEFVCIVEEAVSNHLKYNSLHKAPIRRENTENRPVGAQTRLLTVVIFKLCFALSVQAE